MGKESEAMGERERRDEAFDKHGDLSDFQTMFDAGYAAGVRRCVEMFDACDAHDRPWAVGDELRRILAELEGEHDG